MSTRTTQSATTSGLYGLEGNCRQHRYVCTVCGERGDWVRSASVAHDSARHHLAHEHPEHGVVWS